MKLRASRKLDHFVHRMQSNERASAFHLWLSQMLEQKERERRQAGRPGKPERGSPAPGAKQELRDAVDRIRTPARLGPPELHIYCCPPPLPAGRQPHTAHATMAWSEQRTLKHGNDEHIVRRGADGVYHLGPPPKRAVELRSPPKPKPPPPVRVRRAKPVQAEL